MYSEFAYSKAMQIILAVMTFAFTFAFIYLIANLILQIFGDSADRKQKCIFAFLIGGALNTIWTYAIYFIGGMRPFSPMVYALVVNPNPVFAMLYYIIGIKVLRLPPTRSIKLMGHVYLYYIIIQVFNRILNTLLFVQPSGRYNFMLDATCQIALLCVVLMIYFATSYFIKRYDYTINLNLFIDFNKELVSFILKSTFVYLIIVGLPIFISNQIVANLVILIICALIFYLTNLLDLYSSAKREIEHKNEYIRMISKNGVHIHERDIFCLSEKMAENPSFVSILISKRDYAESMGVKISMELQTHIDDFHIDNIDICRIMDCLLDNAIEAAADSERREVSFTVESKPGGEKLTIINNTTAAPIDINGIVSRYATGENGRRNKRISTVRKIVSKYGNCTFQMVYHDSEASTYLETKSEPRQLAGILTRARAGIYYVQ